MKGHGGAVACGHEVTAAAATEILRAGGNAFDAAAGAVWAACVAEPLLASPCGGGFLLARTGANDRRAYDFFVHTPRRRRPTGESDFREILGDFGPTQQVFGIGLGTVATPGVVAGVFRFHRDLGRMPMSEVVRPAVKAAREGVRVNRMQAYVGAVLTAIMEAARGVPTVDTLVNEGDVVQSPELADFIETLALEGESLFYKGEVAALVDRAFRGGGGHLTREDFEGYRVARRNPLTLTYRGNRIWTNPPPASGGLLVAFGLQVLAGIPPHRDLVGTSEASRITTALAAMSEARLGEGLEEGVDDAAAARVLSPGAAARYLERAARHPPAHRGTTHISVLDRDGRAAALSLSNGEGCGWMVPGTGMMMNNMLGEADLQPRGLDRWPVDTRLTSMMAPTVVEESEGGRLLVLGSGGSSRIRSAILQVLSGVLDHGTHLARAIWRPRLHLHEQRLEIEGGFAPETIDELKKRWPDHVIWPDMNLFFGGVHAVRAGPEGASAEGDPRRGGHGQVLPPPR